MGGIDLWHVFIVLIAVGIYLLPTLIAFRRDHPKRMPILGLEQRTFIRTHPSRRPLVVHTLSLWTLRSSLRLEGRGPKGSSG